jgi:tetratricopeptide (TPR) repeat protein
MLALLAGRAQPLDRPLAALDKALADGERALQTRDFVEAEHSLRVALVEGWTVIAALDDVAHNAEAAGRARRHADAERDGAAPSTPSSLDKTVAALSAADRATLESQARTAVARAAFNLGVLDMQRQHFDRAAARFELAGDADPQFPNLQYSLGVAYFNLRDWAQALPPLSKAFDADRQNPDIRRMVALTEFNLEHYARSAALLGPDPERDRDPSLQYTYGVALVRSGRAEEATQVFSALLTHHANSAAVNVVLGLAAAEQGDYDAAVDALTKARQIDPKVPEASTTIGVIRLKQGRLAESEQALRDALTAHPDDARARHTLAEVLDLQGKHDEAANALRELLAADPKLPQSHYLLGKILLSQGSVEEAITHLQKATELAPEEANGHYQLAQAYQRKGDDAGAQREFERFQALKERRRDVREP